MTTIDSKIKTYTYQDGNIQKVQTVTLDSWDELNFFNPTYCPDSFDKLCNLYQKYFVNRAPMIFGKMVVFRLPDDIEIPDSFTGEQYGTIYNRLTLVAIVFKKHIRVKNNKIIIEDKQTQQFYQQLVERDCIRLICGKNPTVQILPVNQMLGAMSQCHKDAKLKVNTSFFVMDCFDLGSIYDSIGTPVGLQVKDGKILTPALFDREVLTVDYNEQVDIKKISLNDLTVIIDGVNYKHNHNCTFYSRPQYKKTPKGGYDTVIIGKNIIAVKQGGNCLIPSSGFVVHTENQLSPKSTDVEYGGLENYKFALQVGNSAIINNVKTEKFISPFHVFYKPFAISYPPAMYPLNYTKARAPRIVLGCNQQNKPMILWFEGAGKFGYQPKKESCGASLSEVSEICQDLGMKYGINLDGGGSAQILLDNSRQLKISDRDPVEYFETERAVPSGLIIY